MYTQPGLKREYLFLNWQMSRDGNVELLPSYHLNAPAPSSLTPRSDVAWELLGAQEHLLETHWCHTHVSNGDPGGIYRPLHEILPWYPEIEKIALHRGEKVYTIDVEKQPPTISIETPTPEEGPGAMVRIAYRAHHPTRVVTCLLRYSNNEGQDWRTVAVNLTKPWYLANLDLLPGGSGCVFQVVASAGIRTAVAQTEPFSVPRKARSANILLPASGASFEIGEPVVLRGFGFSPDLPSIEPSDLIWTSNVAGLLGIGQEVAVPILRVGAHRVVLSMPDGLGGEAVSAVSIAVRR